MMTVGTLSDRLLQRFRELVTPKSVPPSRDLSDNVPVMPMEGEE